MNGRYVYGITLVTAFVMVGLVLPAAALAAGIKPLDNLASNLQQSIALLIVVGAGAAAAWWFFKGRTALAILALIGAIAAVGWLVSPNVIKDIGKDVPKALNQK